MKFIKKIIVIFFVMHTAASASPIHDECNMNGTWYEETFPIFQFQVTQLGSSIIITTPNSQPGKQMEGSGSIIPGGAQFSLITAEKEVINFKGVFSISCDRLAYEAISNRDGHVMKSTLLRVPIKINDPKEDVLVISAEPRMPNFDTKVILDNPINVMHLTPDIPAYTWGIKIRQDIGSDMHINAYLDNISGEDPFYHADFSNLKEITKEGDIVGIPGSVAGGQLILSVDYYRNLHVEKSYTIKGTNPGQVAIERVITDKTLRQIACQESHYKQFIAPREGGIGSLNTKSGSRGGVGIMQLFDPKPTTAEAWNWKENLNRGKKLYAEKRAIALHHPAKELADLNDERRELGLPACTKPLPKLNPEQLAREILRLYNCGFEYYWEPRDSPNCEGQWVISPSCAREDKPGYDPEYVNNVLKCDINH